MYLFKRLKERSRLKIIVVIEKKISFLTHVSTDLLSLSTRSSRARAGGSVKAAKYERTGSARSFTTSASDFRVSASDVNSYRHIKLIFLNYISFKDWSIHIYITFLLCTFITCWIFNYLYYYLYYLLLFIIIFIYYYYYFFLFFKELKQKATFLISSKR